MVNVSQAPAVPEMPAAVVPPAGGATIVTLPSAEQDLARFFLNLAGSSSLGAVGGVAGAAASASGVGVQLCPSAPGGDPVASCTATAVPAGLGGPPSASAAVPGSSGRQQRQETSQPSRRGRRLSSDGTVRASKKCPRGRSPSPGPSRRRERSYRSSSESSEEAQAETSPPRARRVPGGTPGYFQPAPAGDRSPRPGPSGWTAQSSTRAERYRSGAGRRSPSPSGVAGDDRSSAFDTVDFDRDDSFRSVLGLIRNFHGMEEPAGIPSARCKTSLASIYGLMSETSAAFHLPTSPMVRSLLDDTNLALSKFLEDQTVHGFLPVPGRRHRRYYRTSSSSFPGLYSVPPGVTSITLEKASEARKRSVSLLASEVSSLETMLSGVCEVSSWLDWWLSTCGGFREHMLDEVRADFERLILFGSRALEFLASQGCTALGNLVLSRRDSLLALSHPRDCDKREVRSCALADCEVSRHDHQYRGRQGFSVSGVSREIPDGSGEFLYHGGSPSSALAGDPRSPGFARATGSSRTPSDEHFTVASEGALVPLSQTLPLFRCLCHGK